MRTGHSAHNAMMLRPSLLDLHRSHISIHCISTCLSQSVLNTTNKPASTTTPGKAFQIFITLSVLEIKARMSPLNVGPSFFKAMPHCNESSGIILMDRDFKKA